MSESGEPITFLGIDGTNWVHVLWHAKSGRGVVQAVVERASALVRKLQPAAAVACFDRRSFRHALVSGYKSGRKARPPELDAALAETETAIATVCTVAAEDGYEADDGLATLAAYGRAASARVILASPDKDLRQCLGAGVQILQAFTLYQGEPTKGDWYNEMRLFDDYNLSADQWTDFQCLVGDRGDSIDGCKLWGEKTSAEALVRCRTLDAMLANPWAVPCSDRQRGELIKFKPQVATVRQLVTLRTDCAAVFDALR